ncbi:choice-of-anchor D domain-containing protein [Leptospira langatensis]|uniref:Choice-of-anchor D domain-containing protein n=1 Tax=Leptospira langatensis TaxID=2484983 RepID=A0A5F1ZX48_9LEPT|nr:choice-of-anchor D domain-containing protein [Leptospira langatensis]TGJ98517.1 choice-of-anchor D domain-containing protein [Leptospira langatensis]TGL43432.1 choice-of-anchor D domain-containing protein [Leptospira langatensis]
MRKFLSIVAIYILLLQCNLPFISKKQSVLPFSLNYSLFSLLINQAQININYNPTSGGILSSHNMSLVIPVGATNSKIEISGKLLKEIPLVTDPNLIPAGIAYEFSPHGTEFNFNQLPILTFKYDRELLTENNITEDNLMIYYYDNELEEYVPIGGKIDKQKKTISASLEHFSIYIVAAQAEKPTNTLPAVGAPSCLPACGAATTRAGSPLYVRSVITDPDADGAIVDVTLYYRIVGSPTYNSVPMQIENAVPPVLNRYAALIPSNFVTTAGIDFYITATDNLGGIRIRAPLIRTPTTSICSVSNPANFTISSGFQKLITLAGTAGTICPGATNITNIIAESYSISNGVGNLNSAGSNGILFDAQKTGVGVLTTTVGIFTTNTSITVKNGEVSSIEILDENSLPINNVLGISPNYNYSFDAVGKDAYGNQILVLPNWSNTGLIGSFTSSTSGILNTAGGNGSGTISATLGSKSKTINVVVTSVNPPTTGIFAVPGISSITITWDTVVGANSYNLYYTTDGSIPSKLNGIKVSNVTSPYIHSSLTDGTTYNYVLTSTNSGPPGPPTGYESLESSPFSAIPLPANTPTSPTFNLKIGVQSQTFDGKYTFNSVLQNTQGSSVAFTVENLGAANLQFLGAQAVQIYGANADQFQFTQPIFPVLPGQSSNFNIRFSPTSPGIKTGELTILCNDPNTPYFRLNLEALSVCSGDGVEDLVGWNKKIDGNSGDDSVGGTAFDGSGNIYVVGYGTNLVSTTSGTDWWIKKFNSAGTEVITNWNKKIDGGIAAAAQAIAIDSSDNIYVVGYATNLVSTTSGTDWWIKKFNSAGTEVTTNWNKKFDGGKNANAIEAIVDSSGNLYVIGMGTNLVSTTSGTDWWIKKFNSAGTEDVTNWNKIYDGGSDAKPFGSTIDSSGNIYIAGYGTNLVSANSGSDWWIKKFSLAGIEDTASWNKIFTSPNPGNLPGETAMSIKSDKSDNIYVSGVAFNLISSNSGSNMWIKKFNPNGMEDLVGWNKRFSNYYIGANIVLDSSGSLFITGATPNLSGGTNNTDIFIKKYLSTGLEDTANWNKVFDNGFNDYGLRLLYHPSGFLYFAGTSLNAGSQNTNNDNDWILKKFQASACY